MPASSVSRSRRRAAPRRPRPATRPAAARGRRRSEPAENGQRTRRFSRQSATGRPLSLARAARAPPRGVAVVDVIVFATAAAPPPLVSLSLALSPPFSLARPPPFSLRPHPASRHLDRSSSRDRSLVDPVGSSALPPPPLSSAWIVGATLSSLPFFTPATPTIRHPSTTSKCTNSAAAPYLGDEFDARDPDHRARGKAEAHLTAIIVAAAPTAGQSRRGAEKRPTQTKQHSRRPSSASSRAGGEPSPTTASIGRPATAARRRARRIASEERERIGRGAHHGRRWRNARSNERPEVARGQHGGGWF